MFDNGGYPSYPFDNPDKTYSPAEFAARFPVQPPRHSPGERTPVTDRESANVPSTPLELSGKYPGVRTKTCPTAPQTTYPAAPQTTYPAAPQTTYPVAPKKTYPAALKESYPTAEETYPAAPGKTSPSQQPPSIQDRRPPVIHFPRSVIALADSARSQDSQFDSSDLNHSPSSSSKPSGKTQRPPKVPTQSSYSKQLLRQSVDRLTITSDSAPAPSDRGKNQSSSNGSGPALAPHPSPLNTHQSCNLFGGQTSIYGEASALNAPPLNIDRHGNLFEGQTSIFGEASALNPSPLNTHQRGNLFGGQTSVFAEASDFSQYPSNITTTTQTSPVRRQALVITLDQPPTMPKLLSSVDSAKLEADSTTASPDSTADVPTNVAVQAAGPSNSNIAATPGNQAAGFANRPSQEARIIRAALKCNYVVSGYASLPLDESTKTRAAMYLDRHPPYLSDYEKTMYRAQYDSVFSSAGFSLVCAAG